MRVTADSLKLVRDAYEVKIKEDSVRWQVTQDSLVKLDSIIAVARVTRTLISKRVDTLKVVIREQLPDSLKPQFDSLITAHAAVISTFEKELEAKQSKIDIYKIEVDTLTNNLFEVRKQLKTATDLAVKATRPKSLLRSITEKVGTVVVVLAADQIIRH